MLFITVFKYGILVNIVRFCGLYMLTVGPVTWVQSVNKCTVFLFFIIPEQLLICILLEKTIISSVEWHALDCCIFQVLFR